MNAHIYYAIRNSTLSRTCSLILNALEAENHDVAVGTEHDQDVSERVEQHDLRRHALHLCERVVQLALARVEPHLQR